MEIDDGDAMMHLLTEGLNGGEDAGGCMEGVGLEHVGEGFQPGVVVVVWEVFWCVLKVFFAEE